MIDARMGQDHHGEMPVDEKQLTLDMFVKFSSIMVELKPDVRHNLIVNLAGWYLATENARCPDDSVDVEEFLSQVLHNMAENQL